MKYKHIIVYTLVDFYANIDRKDVNDSKYYYPHDGTVINVFTQQVQGSPQTLVAVGFEDY